MQYGCQTMWPMTSTKGTFCSSWIGIHTCEVSPRSVQPLQFFQTIIFLKVFFNNMAAESHDRSHHQCSFSMNHFIPRWPSKCFILIRCSILHMQLWHHNEGTYVVIKNQLIHTCRVPSFNISLSVVSEIQRSKFSRFSNMADIPCDLWHHDYD